MTRTHAPSPTRAFVDTEHGPAPDPDTVSLARVGSAPPTPQVVGPIRRRAVDAVLIAVGVVMALVLFAAGSLLLWGHRFAEDYVGDELAAQNISFPDAAALEADGRSDLLEYAGAAVTTGGEAEAYAGYIAGHLEEIADGATYADLGPPERDAAAAVDAAVADDAPQATVDELQSDADAISDQRNSLFKGETLRGLLLSTYAWATIGTIAGIAAMVAFAGGGVMVVLVALGVFHRRRTA